uniref:LY6/PLAUR domain containing 6B n=1 Tax=Latimeria chalumnae TaxID=7897 RepID=M3XHD6_LATCH
ATPFLYSFKCFTCDSAPDNYNCNRWAEDKWCPQDTDYCLTIHHFTSHGKSKSVTKRCAKKEECHFVGCHHHHHRDFGHTECTSCCEGMICNVDVPTNHTNAVFAVIQSGRAPSTSKRTLSFTALLTVVMTTLFL